MRGTTHLAIGTAIGGAAAAYYPFNPANAAVYMAVAVISALSADLDGPSLLSRKIGKLSKMLRTITFWSGLLSAASAVYFYFIHDYYTPATTAIALALFLLGLVMREGVIRNTLVSLVGAVLLYTSLQFNIQWLLGFGLFVIWVPWLKHRGLSHTVWALLLWILIGRELESELQIAGLTRVAAAGYLSHLLADTLTPSGVKWFYPLYKKAIKLKIW
ncbi:metal-dependent hydrolase [Paenibacillus tarimensis]|uniref:metal-dependent hydrolase n=1 Tax=Paenibacillus tarimensis TaxID=416012 RepID=UPI001F39EF2A|nr:metal-dependent hydrolase [Paenibacillus tarimensis]MCF2943290.1 metal-dependent hydrolase [Paenibacillus tarimensis]